MSDDGHDMPTWAAVAFGLAGGLILWAMLLAFIHIVVAIA